MAASTAQSIRAFIAIPLEQELVEAFQNVQQQIGAALPEGTVRWVKADQLHLTLKFLGNVSRERLNDLVAALQRACAGVAPFQLWLEGVGCFPDAKNPRVLWIGMSGALEPLGRLQTHIGREASSFGDHTEERAFQPHLTIGRVKAVGKGARDLGECVGRVAMAKPGEWNVREVHLIQSELSPGGARYKTLATVPLRVARASGP